MRQGTENIQSIKNFNRNTKHWNVKISDASNKRGKWNHLKTIQNVPEQHIKKARFQGTRKNDSHIAHCTNTSESTNVKVKHI